MSLCVFLVIGPVQIQERAAQGYEQQDTWFIGREGGLHGGQVSLFFLAFLLRGNLACT